MYVQKVRLAEQIIGSKNVVLFIIKATSDQGRRFAAEPPGAAAEEGIAGGTAVAGLGGKGMGRYVVAPVLDPAAPPPPPPAPPPAGTWDRGF